MSYDLWLTADGDHAANGDAELAWLNVTYNLAPMFRRAIAESGIRDDDNRSIRTIHGMTGRSASYFVRGMVEAMETDPETYRALEPENKWGTYESCLDFLRKVITASDAHPDAKWGGD